jgi:hypothetical protein
MSAITAAQLAERVQTKLGCGYVYGALGQVTTDAQLQSLAKQYPAMYTAVYLAKCRKNIGVQSFDCVGLVKYFGWGNTGNKLTVYDAATDVSANGAYERAKVKGPIADMPDVPGLCVRFPGHIWVYVGGGSVVEARGVDYGVVLTRLADRPWTHWIEYPYGVDYAAEAPAARPEAEPGEPSLRDTVFGLAGTGDEPSSWAQDACAWAKETGLFQGDGQGSYGWQQGVTREQLAMALFRSRG